MADEQKGWAQRAAEWSERTQREAVEKAAAKRRQQATKDLVKATRNWSATNCVRRYEGNQKGDQLFQDESDVLSEHGYLAKLQTDDGGHVHVGRLLLTGGLSAFAGSRGIRSKGKYSVTFEKGVPQPSPAAQPDIPDQLRKLAELRDAGILTPEEFDSKKASLLERM